MTNGGKNRLILVLGSAGLVGLAVCRSLLRDRPAALFVASLDEPSASAAINELCRGLPDSPTG